MRKFSKPYNLMARQPNSSSAMSKPMNWDLCIVSDRQSHIYMLLLISFASNQIMLLKLMCKLILEEAW